MSSRILPLALAGLILLAGCNAIPGNSTPRYDVSVETVTINGSQTEIIAITPLENGTLPKGAEVTIDGGYVTITETTTMSYKQTAYLVYAPSRTKFELTD